MTTPRDATGFRFFEVGEYRAWISNDGHRCIVQRAPNRFQAYEWIEDDRRHYSVGYTLSASDCRLFLSGHQVTVMSEWGEDTDKEPLTFRHPALTTF